MVIRCFFYFKSKVTLADITYANNEDGGNYLCQNCIQVKVLNKKIEQKIIDGKVKQQRQRVSE